MRFAEQWSWCTVAAIRDVTPRIREFRLRPDNGLVPPYPAGQPRRLARDVEFADRRADRDLKSGVAP